MCLTIRNFKTKKEAITFSKKPKKAIKDITVYKVLNLDNRSIYEKFLYEKGKEYYRYGEKLFGISVYKQYYGAYKIEIDDGLHAYTSKVIARRKSDYDFSRKMVKMIIPKGALYFEDKLNHEIVSSKLW